MTLVAPEHRTTSGPPTEPKGVIAPDGLGALQVLMQRAIAPVVRGDSALLRRVVNESIEAFVIYDGDPKQAAAQVAPLLWKVGEQHAHRDLGAEDLAESFRQAQMAAQRGLRFAAGSSLSRAAMARLRKDLVLFLQQLHRHAWIGWERANVLLTMPSNQRRERLGSAIFRSRGETKLSKYAEFAGVSLSAVYVVVVSAVDELPRTLSAHPGVLGGETLYEALVPASWSHEKLADQLLMSVDSGLMQVVVGPPMPLMGISDTTELTRRGAELLREGRTFDDRMIVPCTDLLASLVVDGNPQLTDLIVAKHLGPLYAMKAYRRLSAGELLLQWLERGLPIRQLARELGIPAQTAHSRMKNIRALYGDAMEDPAQRLELIIALQATLPRWRIEAEDEEDE